MRFAEEDPLGSLLYPMHMRPNMSVLQSENFVALG